MIDTGKRWESIYIYISGNLINRINKVDNINLNKGIYETDQLLI